MKITDSYLVTKKWGAERWLCAPVGDNVTRYVMKIIEVKAGECTSYQFHNFKCETNLCIKGKFELWLENDNGEIEKTIMGANEYVTINAPKKHRIVAIEDCTFVECSTPEVDDVVRVSDNYGREGMNYRIQTEHSRPLFIILASGRGSRMSSVDKNLHKSLLKIGDKAAISYLIDLVPTDYDIIITTGYNSQLIESYIKESHPNRRIKCIKIDGWEHGFGHTFDYLRKNSNLERPFYFCVADLFPYFSKLPTLNDNWISVFETDIPELYSTALIDNDNNITAFKNKSKDGYDCGFSGMAGIYDYNQFFENLGYNREVIWAFQNNKNFPLKAKFLDVGDIGIVDGYHAVLNKLGYSNEQKNISEQNYIINNRFIKINSNKEINKNRGARAEYLKNIVPPNIKTTDYSLSYDYLDGFTLYQLDREDLYNRLVDFVFDNINKSKKWPLKDLDVINNFYRAKTINRLGKFLEKNSIFKTLDVELIINGEKVKNNPSKIDLLIDNLKEIELYELFHGDLQPDNIIADSNSNRLYYIDWRPDFSGLTEGGDIYYDLAKLYGGLLFDYYAAKNLGAFDFNFIGNEFFYNVPQSLSMEKSLEYFLDKCEKNGYDVAKLKRMVALIWINMSPLHHHPYDKVLYLEAIKLLNR